MNYIYSNDFYNTTKEKFKISLNKSEKEEKSIEILNNFFNKHAKEIIDKLFIEMGLDHSHAILFLDAISKSIKQDEFENLE